MFQPKFDDVIRRLKEGAELTTSEIATATGYSDDATFDRLAREGRSLGLECRGDVWRYNVGPGSPFATDSSPIRQAG